MATATPHARADQRPEAIRIEGLHKSFGPL